MQIQVDNWDEDTEFALNFDLKSRRARIKIPMPQTYRQVLFFLKFYDFFSLNEKLSFIRV